LSFGWSAELVHSKADSETHNEWSQRMAEEGKWLTRKHIEQKSSAIQALRWTDWLRLLSWYFVRRFYLLCIIEETILYVSARGSNLSKTLNNWLFLPGIQSTLSFSKYCNPTFGNDSRKQRISV
jgi:hypothetical protein